MKKIKTARQEPAPSSAKDSVILGLARKLDAAWRLFNDFDGLGFKTGHPLKTRLNDHEMELQERIDALEFAIAALPARNLTEAAIQLRLLCGNLECTEEPWPAVKKRLIYSVLAALEDETGLSREEFGGKVFAASCADPWHRDMALLAEATKALQGQETRPPKIQESGPVDHASAGAARAA